MERESVLYKLRRKLQVGASYILPAEFLSKVYFRIVLKKKLNLKNPQTFNEKLQWMKLYYYPKDHLVIQCADKYAVREFIKMKGYSNILVPQIGVWDDVKDIPWEELPKQFVLKCNHGCAYNIICKDKENFDIKSSSKKLNTWMKEDFGAFNIEPHYSKIKNRKIICEEYLGEKIIDYKFFCFNGKPEFMFAANNLDNDREGKVGFYFLDGSKMSLKRDDYKPLDNIKFPSSFNEIKKCAAVLSKPFPFVRVDFFLANNNFYFAELTFTPSACMMPINPEKYDFKWGELINIKNGD